MQSGESFRSRLPGKYTFAMVGEESSANPQMSQKFPRVYMKACTDLFRKFRIQDGWV